jgi:hypothetical protein
MIRPLLYWFCSLDRLAEPVEIRPKDRRFIWAPREKLPERPEFGLDP